MFNHLRFLRYNLAGMKIHSILFFHYSIMMLSTLSRSPVHWDYYWLFDLYNNTPLFQSAKMLFARACQLIKVTRHVHLYKSSGDEIPKKIASIPSVNLDH